MLGAICINAREWIRTTTGQLLRLMPASNWATRANGGREIRTPGGFTHCRLATCCHRPLGDPSIFLQRAKESNPQVLPWHGFRDRLSPWMPLSLCTRLDSNQQQCGPEPHACFRVGLRVLMTTRGLEPRTSRS